MDYFLFRGNIWLGNGQFCDALIVRRGRIAAVGRQQALYPLAEDCSFIDCGGRTVIPGIFDACLCLAAAGTTLPDGRAGLEAACKTWLTAHPPQAKKGAHLFWRSEGETLTTQQMDAIWQDAPLVLEDMAEGACWANAVAVQRLAQRGIPASCAPWIDVGEDGRPTGLFRGPACRLIASVIPEVSQLQQKKQFRAYLRQAAQAGITTVQSTDLLFQPSHKLLPVLRQLYREEKGLPRLQFLCPENSKLPADRPRSPEKQPAFAGKLVNFTDIEKKRRTGGQLLVPVENREALEALLEHLRQTPLPTGNPGRVTLLGCDATGDRQLQELGDAGLGVIGFPARLDTVLRRCAAQTGVQLETCCAWRTMGHLGAKVAFGGLDRAAPFAAMQKAVGRKAVTAGGESHPSKEALSREEALTAMTAGAAWTDFQEELTGRLRMGFRADLQVLDGDPFTCHEMQLGQIRPVLVMAGGQLLLREI